jgi:hypothetical protein
VVLYAMARPAILRIAKSFNKKFWIARGIFLDSIIYDAELTRQRLAHHRCVEDTLTGQHSPRAEIYGNNLLEQFLPLTFMQRALGKYVWKGQRHEGATLGLGDPLPRWHKVVDLGLLVTAGLLTT